MLLKIYFSYKNKTSWQGFCRLVKIATFAHSTFKTMAVYQSKKSVPGTKPNYLYSIFGVTLVLIMLGFFGLLMIQANELIKFMKEKVEIITELKDQTTEEDRNKLIAHLRSQSFVKKGSIKYLSKEAGAKVLQKEFGEEFLKLDMPNPLFDVITFNINSEDIQNSNIESLTADIKTQPVVRDLYFQENFASMVAGNLKNIGFIFLAIGLFLLLVAVFLIHNTIRLALYANRFLIKNMELVGASWEFISRPYLKRSVIHGLVSGLLAVLILSIGAGMIQQELPGMETVTNYTSIGILMVLLPILGIVISSGSTFYVVNKYLRMRVDDMY